MSLLDDVRQTTTGLARLDTALSAVIGMKGSDLHVAAGAMPMVRVSGALRPVRNVGVWTAEDVRDILTAAMSPQQLERFQSELELDFAYALGDQARFRVNVYRQREAWGAAFRLIPTEIKSFDDLGLPEALSSFADLPRGLVLVTGPTGSGKSTTLAALIDRANESRADHIMTIEDPIEFVHTSKKALVNQREVGTDTHSFGAALKHVLRQDPDIILLGELRDLESIHVALTAAETGHLVFATLHTSDAAQSIDRIVDVFPADQQQQVRMQLSMVLQGVVCQTLVPRADGQGRAVAVEILRVTPAIGNLIRTGKTSQLTTAMQTGVALGMQTMDQHLVTLIHSGVISLEAAEAKAQDVNTLRQMAGSVKPRAAATTDTFSTMGGFR
ncbi:type IV pilus twitching motility protein PilT [Amnibacterium soli]|uniref:Type IV pilus twitching motility protein PilT n=1 Tax=Amnibacterium soli TaxID=1282736 RepID=A0ABP8Z8K4_9MICO